MLALFFILHLQRRAARTTEPQALYLIDHGIHRSAGVVSYWRPPSTDISEVMAAPQKAGRPTIIIKLHRSTRFATSTGSLTSSGGNARRISLRRRVYRTTAGIDTVVVQAHESHGQSADFLDVAGQRTPKNPPTMDKYAECTFYVDSKLGEIKIIRILQSRFVVAMERNSHVELFHKGIISNQSISGANLDLAILEHPWQQ